MKTEITKIKGDWMEVASDCRSTVGKPPLDHEPSVDFKKKILLAEHSPIRDISMRKRLCRQSSTETRQYAEDFKAALHEIEPEISDVLVPQCVYRAGCAEMKPCGDGKCFFDVLIDQTAGAVATTHIQDRYDAYNKFFYERRKSE